MSNGKYQRYEDDEDLDYLDEDEIERGYGAKREARLALASLKIEESLTCSAGKAWNAMKSAVSACGYYSCKKFTTRKVGDGLYRVWRTR